MSKWYLRVMRDITLPMRIHSMDSRILQSSCLLLLIPFSMLIPTPTKMVGRQDPNLLQLISISLRPFQLTEMFIQRSFHYSLVNVAVNVLELYVPVSIFKCRKKLGCRYLGYNLQVDHLKNLHLQLLEWIVKPFPE